MRKVKNIKFKLGTKELKKYQLFDILGSISGIVVLAVMFMAISPGAIDGASADSTIPVSVDVEQYLNAALKNTANASMEIAPAKDGSFIESGNITLDINTNNPTGYKLLISTESGTAALTNTAGDTIEAVERPVTETDFPMNHWGYQYGLTGSMDDKFQAVPELSTVIDNQNTDSASYNFNFGVKVNATKSGVYRNTIILSTVANPATITDITDLTYMQDMTTALCNNTKGRKGGDVAKDNESSTVSLIDSRDGKSYNVTKLADGKCWMTDNLNLAGGTTVEPTKSDVATSWTLPASSAEGFSDNNTAYVYNDSTYGGYYSWRAATANTGTTSVTSGDAPSSICPKGWRLPTKATFEALISIYSTGVILTIPPISMQYGGYYANSSAQNSGRDGHYWSSTANDSRGAFGLYFSSDSANRDVEYKNTGRSVRCIAR